MKKIYIIHENNDWMVNLRAALTKLELEYEEWFIGNLSLDLNGFPPEGVFYNRMSASSHLRDHRYAPEMTENILSWLELNDRKVVNGRRAIQLELRKSEQYLALKKQGIQFPKTIIVNHRDLLLKAVEELNCYPFIIKPNRGGKGAGVTMFRSKESLEQSLASDEQMESLDGIFLVQDYIKPHDGKITRAEFVGGRFMYSVRIDTSGGFQLCPADSCTVGDDFCPVGESSPKFEIMDDDLNDDAELKKFTAFLKDNDIGIAAIEFVQNAAGERFVYDVNTNLGSMIE